MHAGRLAAVPVDPGGGPDSLDLGDAEERPEHEDAVDDRELGPVERAHGRPRRPIPLRVVLAAVARTAESGREHGRDLRGVWGDPLRLVGEDQSVRLHGAAEMGAAGVDEREARLAVDPAVVAHEHRAPRHLADVRVLQVGRDHERPFGELVDRAERRVLLVLVRERRQHREAEHGQRDDPPDHSSQPERRDGQEGVARIGLELRLAGGHGRGSRRDERAGFRLDLRGGSAHRPRHVPDPEEAEDDCDHRADDGGDRADDETGEDAGDPNREADRPEARRRQMRLVVLAQVTGFNPCATCAVNDVSAAATRGESHSLLGRRRRAPVSRTRPSGCRPAP